jgi:hypothetical protein
MSNDQSRETRLSDLSLSDFNRISSAAAGKRASAASAVQHKSLDQPKMAILSESKLSGDVVRPAAVN